MKPTSPAEVREYAEASFASGLYCAESVVLAIAGQLGIQSELLPKIATPLCSGLSRTCGTCGAVSGALLGIGLALGRSTPDGSVEPAYGAARSFIREFEQAYGSCNCQVLLGGCDLNTPEGQAHFAGQNLMQQCLKMTGKAAEIAARIIAENKA